MSIDTLKLDSIGQIREASVRFGELTVLFGLQADDQARPAKASQIWFNASAFERSWPRD